MTEFRYETFASAGPSLEQLKEKVDKSRPAELIAYNGKVYAIRFQELRNLGLDYHDEIVGMCRRKGLEDPAFFGRACMYCGNATTNLEDLIGNSDEVIVINFMPQVNCVYSPEKDIRVASIFTDKDEKQKPFYAVVTKRCAFDDSLIAYLADNGLLQRYEVQIDFDFRPITDFNKDSIIPEAYLLESVQKRLPENQRVVKKGIFSRIFGLLRKNNE